MRTIPQLVDSIHQEAQREPFPIDTPIYEKAGKDPLQPILFAGSLTAPPCVFGRDLGKDEVAAGQPLIGAGGGLSAQESIRHAMGSRRRSRIATWSRSSPTSS